MFTRAKFLFVIGVILLGVCYMFLVALSLVAMQKIILASVIIIVFSSISFLFGYYLSSRDFELQEMMETRYGDEFLE